MRQWLRLVESMMQLLSNGGRCGVIVPDGVLFKSSEAHKNLRHLLLEKCQLEGIVSMPSARGHKAQQYLDS